jgi:hypothetical protein
MMVKDLQRDGEDCERKQGVLRLGWKSHRRVH